MIGIGGNRLSVSRGMGVVAGQAMSGMALLGDVRMPKWASPYSGSATAILKASFPNHWAQIRDYGWEHPEMVEWVNEDPMLVCSLVECGVYRWVVVENGWTGIDEWAKGQNLDISVEFIAKPQLVTWRAIFFQGSKSGRDAHIFLVTYRTELDKIGAYMGNPLQIEDGYSVVQNKIYKMRLKNRQGFWVNDVKIKSSSNLSASIVGPLIIGETTSPIKRAIVLDDENLIDWTLIPILSNSGSKLIDINSMTVKAINNDRNKGNASYTDSAGNTIPEPSPANPWLG